MKIKSKFSFWAVMMGLIWPSVNCMNSDNVGEHNQQSVLLGFTVLNEADDPGSEQDLPKTGANEQQSSASEDRIDLEEIIKNVTEDPTPVILESEFIDDKQAIAEKRKFIASEMERLQKEMDDCVAYRDKIKTGANEQQGPASEDRIDLEEIMKNVIEDPTPVISESEFIAGRQMIAEKRKFIASEMERLQKEMGDCVAYRNKMQPYFRKIYDPEARKKRQQTLSKVSEINSKMRSLRNMWHELFQYEQDLHHRFHGVSMIEKHKH